MTTQLTARAMGGEQDDDDEVLEAGFSEFEDGTGFALLFQRPTYEPNEQETELGWDTYCLTTGDGKTHYGGLEAVALEGARLSIKLKPGAADILGLDRDIEVDLQVDDDSLRRFGEVFPRVVTWGRAEEVPTISGF
ncbi:Imm10 family immunity protein [Planosporangium mesophilum]|uniref:Immunity protein 10 n=1 Tax=Planosporangium mesophilum TaxID=689768 RepID=A0A8J3TD78_9ACTN|nr:Imm10 family immunity protein [Planosporangium mesophilum]NJC86300.1 hypothetical protein [Planosporangium mesophilum]GII23291.1 hypothetical protein Pme01_28880 [Planosporangium mesophilum]